MNDSPGMSRHIGRFGALVLGLVLLVAAWAKLLDPASFVQQIELEGLDFLLPARAVALIALALEVALGVALVAGVRRLWVLVPSALLVAFFLFLTGRAWWLDAHGLLAEGAGCGCFGNLVERTPEQAFWQDLLLLVPALLLSFVGRPRSGREFPPARTALIGLAAVAAPVFAHFAPDLPLDDLATRLKPGVEVSEICTGEGAERLCFDTVVPELDQGSHWVVLAELDDEEFGRSVERLNESVLEGGGPALWAVVTATPEEHQAFFWNWGPAFEIREAPATLLGPLYRSLPRSFRVEDGRVTETHRGLPPV